MEMLLPAGSQRAQEGVVAKVGGKNLARGKTRARVRFPSFCLSWKSASIEKNRWVRAMERSAFVCVQLRARWGRDAGVQRQLRGGRARTIRAQPPGRSFFIGPLTVRAKNRELGELYVWARVSPYRSQISHER